MNKNYYLIAASAALILAGCAKESFTEAQVVAGETTTVTATAIVPAAADGTKIVLTDEFNTEDMLGDVKAAWETGDKFVAFATTGDNKAVALTFEFQSKDAKGVGTFKASGEVTLDDNTVWTAVLGKVTVSDTTAICKYDVQDGTLGNLDDFEYVVVSTKGKTPVFNFADAKSKQLTYVMRLLLPAGIKYIEYNTGTIANGGWNVFPKKAPVSTVSTTSKDAVHMITLPSESSAGQVVYLAIPAVDYGVHEEKDRLKDKTRDAGLIVTIMSADKKQSTGKVLAHKVEGGCIAAWDLSREKLYARPLASEAIDLGSVSYNGTTYPLGAWAPFNLGGNFPTSNQNIVGGNFAWGEVAPRESFTKDGYKWYSGGTYTTQIGFKYTTTMEYTGEHYLVNTIAGGGSSSFTSGTYYDITGTRYDAARVLWGSEWCLPDNIICGNIFHMGHGRLDETIDVEQKVDEKSYVKGTYKNSYDFTSDTMGAVVIKANGKELVLYLTPYTDNGSMKSDGAQSRYWTGTTDYGVSSSGKFAGYWNRSCLLRLYDDGGSGVNNGISYQWDGLQIRPVLSK